MLNICFRDCCELLIRMPLKFCWTGDLCWLVCIVADGLDPKKYFSSKAATFFFVFCTVIGTGLNSLRQNDESANAEIQILLLSGCFFPMTCAVFSSLLQTISGSSVLAFV